MYLNDDVQKTLRDLGKISQNEVVKKQGDLYIAINVLSNESRILTEDSKIIESLERNTIKLEKRILKG